MYDSLEALVLSVTRGKQRGIAVSLLRSFLFCLSLGFRCISTLRSKAYDRGFLKQSRVSVPVISIGNIVAGGTGKTPTVMMIADIISKEHKIAILLRGYRSDAEKKELPTLVGASSDILKVGDEAVLLAKRLPNALVVVCKDRKKGAGAAIQNGATLLILDDGFQHRRLKRDLDVVVVDAQKPVGNNYFLPRGPLRESSKALKRAHLIVLTNCHNKEESNNAIEYLEAYTDAPVVCTAPCIEGIYDFNDKEQKISLEGKKVAIFCAIAHPENFKKTVELAGAKVVHELYGMDHRAFSAKDLKKFRTDAYLKGALMLLCTEKDRVKIIEEFTLHEQIALMWIKMKLQIKGNCPDE
ncbi:MAG: tetraacyldisaccharide 4'-kinase [Chlamydiales bacterium]|nr:tetraacyldisaccharide 4'-kinase [Chlamydiales bacterium]